MEPCLLNEIFLFPQTMELFFWGGGEGVWILDSGPIFCLFIFFKFCSKQVVMPRNAAEAKGLLLASIREPDPVIFLEPKALYRTSVEDVPDGEYEIPLGVADVIREGTDVTLVRKTLHAWT